MITARAVAVLIIGALLLWISVGVTATFTLSRSAPELALSVWPDGAAPQVAVAMKALDAGSARAPTIENALGLARDAVFREPINSDALSTYAALERSSLPHRTRALFKLAERLSRRNTIAEVWLIEDAVAREDIRGAVLHYDRVMRSTPKIRSVTLPVLVSASADPAIRAELIPVLAKQPLWGTDFMAQLAASGSDPVAIAVLIRALKPDLSDDMQRQVLELALRRMIALKGYRHAAALANFVEGKPAQARGLANGDFEQLRGGVSPFAWSHRDEGSVRAYQDTIPTGSQGLIVSGVTDGPAVVTTQLLGLAPGRYALSGKLGREGPGEGGGSYFEFACVDGKSLPRLTLPPAAVETAGFRFTVDIPAKGCPLQWLNLLATTPGGGQFWLDDLAVVPVR